MIALLPELEALRSDFRTDARSSEKVGAAVAEDGVWWAALYELPYEQHLGGCFRSLGLDTHLEVVKTSDPLGLGQHERFCFTYQRETHNVGNDQ